MSAICAFRKTFSQAVMSCCRFHFCQALYRHIAENHLTGEYRNKDSDIRKWLCVFFGLSLLPPAEIEDAFTYDIMAQAPNDERCTNFGDYVLLTYITNVSRFPPYLWASADNDTPRTTNAC